VSGEGAPTAQYQSQPFDCSALRVAILAASWHEEIMDGLVAGSQRAMADFSVDEPALVRVPGSFELPVVAAALAKEGYDAIVALGVVIRGGTPHFEYVCSSATDGLSRVALDHGVAIGFGLLTCDTEAQARDRAGLPGSHEDKGYESASAALVTATTLRKVGRRDETA
jgi:6,7-dimethyl-8-ribityllumazine synthase